MSVLPVKLKPTKNSLFNEHLYCVECEALSHGLGREVLEERKVCFPHAWCHIVMERKTISQSWNFRSRMRTALAWFGFGGARVRSALSRMKVLSVSNSSQRGSMFWWSRVALGCLQRPPVDQTTTGYFFDYDFQGPRSWFPDKWFI